MGFAHSFGKSFGQSGSLMTGNPCAVEFGDGVPANVALGIKQPVGGNVNHGAAGRVVDGELERERFVMLHAVKIPAQTERIEHGLEKFFVPMQIDRK